MSGPADPDPQKGPLEDTVKEVRGPTTTLVDENTPLRSTIRKDAATISSSSSVAPSVDASDLSDNPFADPAVAAHYATVYEKAKYECRHVFDPNLQWTPQEERRLVRKLDWHVCLWAVSRDPVACSYDIVLLNVLFCQCIMFFALQVDRGNLSQAVSDNMLDQLGLTTNGMYIQYIHTYALL